MPNWQIFKHQGSRSATVMRASLNFRGVLTLNQVSFDALLQPKAVELMFDPDEGLIGLKPTSPEVRHAYPVRKQGANKSYLIGAKAFCNFYGIGLSETVAFDEIKIQDGIMVLDLGKVTVVPTRQRQSKASAIQQTLTDPNDIPF
jgi:hypothetical protein